MWNTYQIQSPPSHCQFLPAPSEGIGGSFEDRFSSMFFSMTSCFRPVGVSRRNRYLGSSGILRHNLLGLPSVALEWHLQHIPCSHWSFVFLSMNIRTLRDVIDPHRISK